MANEQEETGDFLLKNFLPVENVNNQVEGAAAGAASLDSTHSSESGASSLLTQIEAISLSNVIEIPASTRNQTKSAAAADAKDGEGGDQSSSLEFHHITSSTNTTTKTTTTLANYGMESGVEEDIQKETNSAATTPTAQDGRKSISASFERDEEMEEQCGGGGGDQDDDLDQSYEDDTLSSEAVVDDIELILMPETVQDFPSADLSPQLVRVTELKRPLLDYDTDVFDDDDERRSDQESDFQKFGTDDENSEISGSVSSRSKLRRRVILASCSLGGGDDDGKEGLSSGRRDYMGQSDQQKSGRKVSCGAQTEITALETTSNSNPFELKQRRPVGKSSTRSSGPTGKRRLNWKSELTLLPSKTKIRTSGFSGYEPMNYQDQYSPRVAKFTSQDTLSSSSQFLKPSTLYRTRNLSRNLNQSSDSTLALTAAGLPSTSESARNRDRMSSSTSSNFKESYSSYHISSSISRRQQQPPPLTSGHSVSFRSSLPDLSSGSQSGKGPRQSFKSMKQNKFSSGCRKKSSSDDETSSLIDESERCLRSSIDLLLTDDLPSPGADFTTRSTGFGGGSRASFGYYSSRRSHSQPILMDDGDCGDLRDVTMGSPFLPRKLSDMRCSRIAKVILPSGQVAVVSVKEMDEMRDTLTVHTDTGCVLSLPFRKVVFAWKLKR